MHVFIVHPSDLLTDHRPHGDGLLAHRFIVELARRGHRVDVACEAVDLATPMPAGVTLHELAVRGSGAVRRVRHVAAIRALFARLDAADPFDVAHQLNPVTTSLSLALVGSRVPLVLGPFVGHWPGTGSALGRSCARVAAAVQQSFASAIVLSSAHAYERIAISHARRKAVIVPYGIDLDAFPKRPFPANAPHVVSLASVEERKGVFVLLDAFDAAARTDARVRLTIAGDGADLDRARRYAMSLAAAERIAFVGRVARQDVSALLASASVFCMPSFGEPYGMAAIEAMATGRPIVVSEGGGIAHVVDERGAVRFPAGDASALARELTSVITDPVRAEAKGDHNRALVERHAWPHVVNRFEALYTSVATRNTAPRERTVRVQSA